jgi:putative MATE family efflux protein
MNPQASPPAKFVTGSTMKHVVVMTATGSFGLMAIFLVDFLNLFYIALLGEEELAAAIGYAGSVLAFNVAIGIGLSIAASAQVARMLGAGDRAGARRMAASALAFMMIIAVAVIAVMWPLIDPILDLLGATGRTKAIAAGFLKIVIPSMPALMLGMLTSSFLRAVGDARRAMYVTLAGGLASAILDPIFIFAFDLQVTGAAIATVLSRCVLVIVGLHGAVRVHGLIGRLDRASFAGDVRALSAIAVPAVATNVATPFGNAYVTATIAVFGDAAVAGWAIIGRLIPVAFGTLFALSGAVGPILGQNFGAGRIDRVRQTLKDSLIFILAYTLAIWAILFLLRHQIVALFGASGESADLVVFFCALASGSFLFGGCLFVANAAFNNLGFATYSTLFNWGRAIIGTVPFVWIGARIGGAEGVVAGWSFGGIIFGLAAAITAFQVTRRLEPGGEPPSGPPVASPVYSPLSSGKSHLG